MRARFVLVTAVLICCGSPVAWCQDGSSRSKPHSSAAAGILPTGLGSLVDRDIARARTATAAFSDLDRAIAAGYPGRSSRCVDHPPHGGMGYHHRNAILVDSVLDVERPEILVYRGTPAGTYQLAGVEYVVPFSAWHAAEPPTVLGQALKPAPSLGIWYLHVWIWVPNPSGLFADWNPDVKC